MQLKPTNARLMTVCSKLARASAVCVMGACSAAPQGPDAGNPCFEDYEECASTDVDDGDCESVLLTCNAVEDRVAPVDPGQLGFAVSGFEPRGDVQLRNGTGTCAAATSSNTLSMSACSTTSPIAPEQRFALFEMADGRFNICLPDTLHLLEHPWPNYNGQSWRAECLQRPDATSNAIELGVKVLSFKGCAGVDCTAVDSPNAFQSFAGHLSVPSTNPAPIEWRDSGLRLSRAWSHDTVALEATLDRPRQLWERVAVGSAARPSTGVKWHPGHYYTIFGWGKDQPTYLEEVYRELATTPAIQGIQIRYLWGELETAPGVYDFSSIDARLADMTTMGRRRVIQVQTKSWDLSWPLIPTDMRQAAYGGGAFRYKRYGGNTITGENITLWNPKVRDRLIRLFAALGERYNGHPNFEGIGMIETAFGTPVGTLPAGAEDGWFANLLEVHRNMRTQFPNTMTIQEVNQPRERIPAIVAALLQWGTALSGPDTFLAEPDLFRPTTPRGVYTYYPEVSGLIPIAPQVMQTNFESTREDGTGVEPTMNQVFTFSRDQLHSNYIFWARHNDPYHRTRLLNFLKQARQRDTVAGGLDPHCPSSYSSCVE